MQGKDFKVYGFTCYPAIINAISVYVLPWCNNVIEINGMRIDDYCIEDEGACIDSIW
jgi:hypothetical protein